MTRHSGFRLVAGAALLVLGLGLHFAAAYLRPSGPDADETLWGVVDWGIIRAAAWGGVAGGVWLLALASTSRRSAADRTGRR